MVDATLKQKNVRLLIKFDYTDHNDREVVVQLPSFCQSCHKAFHETRRN